MIGRVGLAVLLALSACGPSREEREKAETQAALDTLAARRARGETDLSNPEMGSKVLLTLTEWEIKQSHSEVPKGQVTIVIENKGQLPHDVELKSERSRWQSPVIPAGGYTLMTMIMEPGEYTVTSTQQDTAGVSDASRGMKTVLLVKIP